MFQSKTERNRSNASTLAVRANATLAAVLTVVVNFSTSVVAQDFSPDKEIRRTSALASEPLAPIAQSTVTFDQRPTEVGDHVRQTLQVQMELSTRIVQSGQNAHEGVTSMRREQEREVVVTRVADGRLRQARVRFVTARIRPASAAEDEALTIQPVEGKQYLVQREGERLHVTDLQGDIPPLEEFEIIVESLDSIGKPNPLAEFLVGREFVVGESLKVPRALAARLLNLTPDMGEVRLFELTLQRIARDDKSTGGGIAEFLARIETVARTGSQLTTTIAGRVAIEIDTCRAVLANLSGPVNLSAVERTPLGIYQYLANGGVRVAIESEYSASDVQ